MWKNGIRQVCTTPFQPASTVLADQCGLSGAILDQVLLSHMKSIRLMDDCSAGTRIVFTSAVTHSATPRFPDYTADEQADVDTQSESTVC